MSNWLIFLPTFFLPTTYFSYFNILRRNFFDDSSAKYLCKCFSYWRMKGWMMDSIVKRFLDTPEVLFFVKRGGYISLFHSAVSRIHASKKKTLKYTSVCWRKKKKAENTHRQARKRLQGWWNNVCTTSLRQKTRLQLRTLSKSSKYLAIDLEISFLLT